MKLKNAHCEAFVCLNNLTGLAFLLQSVSTAMLLWGVLLGNIIRVIKRRPAWCQWAGREWGGGLLKGHGVVLVMMGKEATQSIPLGKMQTFLACGGCVLVFRDCWPIVCDSSFLSRKPGRWLTFALAFWRRNSLPTT